MTELGDYRRLVEKPMIEAHIAELRRKDAEIKRLRAERDLFAARLGAERLGTPPLARENEQLRAALAIVADENNYRPDIPVMTVRAFQRVARDALEQKG